MYVEYSAVLNRKQELKIWVKASISEIDKAKKQIINIKALKLGNEKEAVSIPSKTVINQIPTQLKENGFKVLFEQPHNNIFLTTQETYPETYFINKKIRS